MSFPAIVARCSVVAALLFLSTARPAAAQGNTAETLRGAVRLYEDLQVERAVVLLRQVISPSSPYEVSRDQRIQAYKYLGAALAVLGQRDSAVVYLRAAVERDPFVDMDPQSFSAPERAALAQARSRTFAVAARPVAATALDPRTERLAFTVLATHAARLAVVVRGAGGDRTAADEATLLESDLDGLREVPWNAVLRDGRLAPPGRYVLLVAGVSTLSGLSDTTQVWFDVRHEREALEDTLPPLGPADLLPERHSTAVASRDLLRGVAMAGAALLGHLVVTDRQLGGGGGYAGAAAIAGTTAGVAAFLMRQRNRDIPANVVENIRRRDARAQHNAGVTQRNAERIGRTRIVVTPAAGAAP